MQKYILGKKIDCRKMAYRVLIYIAGLFILAMGVNFSINSNLGVSPVNSLPYVVATMLDVDMGICVTGIFTILLLLQIVLLRKNFKWINIFQLAFTSIFGYFVDLGAVILGDFTLSTYFGQLVMMAIGIVLVALGVYLYVSTKLINMPCEGLAVALTEILKDKTFTQMKLRIDCTLVFCAIALSFVALGGVQGIREGTILAAILVSIIITQIGKYLNPLINRICFAETEDAVEGGEWDEA